MENSCQTGLLCPAGNETAEKAPLGAVSRQWILSCQNLWQLQLLQNSHFPLLPIFPFLPPKGEGAFEELAKALPGPFTSFLTLLSITENALGIFATAIKVLQPSLGHSTRSITIHVSFIFLTEVGRHRQQPSARNVAIIIQTLAASYNNSQIFPPYLLNVSFEAKCGVLLEYPWAWREA